jgi:hypothetical protein
MMKIMMMMMMMMTMILRKIYRRNLCRKVKNKFMCKRTELNKAEYVDR